MPFALDGWGYVDVLADYYFMFLAGTGTFTMTDFRAQNFISGSDNMPRVGRRSTAEGGDQLTVATAITADTWFYLTATYLDASNMEGYLNAANRAVNTPAAINSAATDRLIIGTAEDGAGYWSATGAMGELAAWNLGSMTQTQREQLWAKRYNGGSGGNGANPLAINTEVGQPWTGALIAYWRLSNTGDLTDLSDNTHDLEMVGTLTNWGGTQPPVDAVPGGGGGSASHILAYKVVS